MRDGVAARWSDGSICGGMAAKTLAEWCEAQIRDTYGTWERLGAAGHIGGGALKKQAEAGTFAIDTALWLAHATGDNPTDLLRLCGKAEIATLIETLYGAARPRRRAVERLCAAAEAVDDDALLERLAALVDTFRGVRQDTPPGGRFPPVVPAAGSKTSRGGRAARR